MTCNDGPVDEHCCLAYCCVPKRGSDYVARVPEPELNPVERARANQNKANAAAGVRARRRSNFRNQRAPVKEIRIKR